MTKQKVLIAIGIDVAKAKFDVAFVYEDDTNKVETFANTNPGIKRFLKKVEKQKTAEAVSCVLESTGLYHLNLALKSRQADLNVSVINPLITKKYQRSSVRGAKTDPIDALRLAEIGLKEKELPIFEANIPSIEARKLACYIHKLEEVKQEILSSLGSVKMAEDITGMSVDLEPTREALKKIDDQIFSLVEKIKELVPTEAKMLSEKVRGLSEKKLSIVMAMLSDKKFENKDKLVAFVGLDVMPRQSGNWQGKGRLSKRGNPYLRKILYQIAWGLKQHNETFKQKYLELRNRGLNYISAMMSLARKFLRILYSWYWKNNACPHFSF